MGGLHYVSNACHIVYMNPGKNNVSTSFISISITFWNHIAFLLVILIELRAYSPIGLIAPSTPCACQEETIEWRMAVDSAGVSPGHK
jgi:hypothetical protein